MSSHEGRDEPFDQPAPSPGTPAGAVAAQPAPAATAPPGGGPPAGGPPASRWTAGRVLSVVIGALLLALGVGASTGGAAVAWATGTQRDAAGYLNTPTERYATTTGYGMRFEAIDIHSWPRDADIGRWLGTVRVQARDLRGGPVFIGIADSRDVAAYCGSAAMMGDYRIGNRRMSGMVMTVQPRTAPTAQSFWVASVSGTGPQTLTWEPTAGTWTLVVMNPDGGNGLDADVTAGATVPALRPIAIGLLIGGGLAVLAGGTLVTLAVLSASSARRRTRVG